MQNNDAFGSITYKETNQNFYKNLPIVEGKPYNSLEDLKNLGFQGSKLYDCYSALKYAISEKYYIVLGFTSNTISCGLREIIAELCQKELVNLIVTTGGAIEEDIIKTKVPFRHLNYTVDDKLLNEYGLNRTENILCPNSGYVWFQNYLKNKGAEDPSFYYTNPINLVNNLRESLIDPRSFLYWTKIKKIPVIPLAIEDGAIGDHFAVKHYEFISKHKDIPFINSSICLPYYLDKIQKAKKICTLILGGGSPKHFIMNGLISTGGSNITIYLNNGVEKDGSNASASPEEAISWGKANLEGTGLKCYGDFVFTFYLLASQIIKDFTPLSVT